MSVPGFEPDLTTGVVVMILYAITFFALAMRVSVKRTME
jgi:hypothetical protein